MMAHIEEFKKILQLKSISKDSVENDLTKAAISERWVVTKPADLIYMTPTHSRSKYPMEEDGVYMSPKNSTQSSSYPSLINLNTSVMEDNVYMSPRMQRSKSAKTHATEARKLSNVSIVSLPTRSSNYMVDMSELHLNDDAIMQDEKLFSIHEKPSPKLPRKVFMRNTSSSDQEGIYERTANVARNDYLSFKGESAENDEEVYVMKISSLTPNNEQRPTSESRLNQAHPKSPNRIGFSPKIPKDNIKGDHYLKVDAPSGYSSGEENAYYVPENIAKDTICDHTTSYVSDEMDEDNGRRPMPPPKTKANLRKEKLKLVKQQLSKLNGSSPHPNNARKGDGTNDPSSMPGSPPPTPPKPSDISDDAGVNDSVKQKEQVQHLHFNTPVKSPLKEETNLPPPRFLMTSRAANPSRTYNSYNYTQVIPKKNITTPAPTSTNGTSPKPPIRPKKPERFKSERKMTSPILSPERKIISSQHFSADLENRLKKDHVINERINKVEPPNTIKQFQASPSISKLKRKARPKVPPPPPPLINSETANFDTRKAKAPPRPPPPTNHKIIEASIRRQQTSAESSVPLLPPTSDAYNDESIQAYSEDYNPYADIESPPANGTAEGTRFTFKPNPQSSEIPSCESDLSSQRKMGKSITSIASNMRIKFGRNKARSSSNPPKYMPENCDEVIYAGIEDT